MNHEPFIERSFLSLINQTFSDFEILYIDNNSSDKSYETADTIFKGASFNYRSFKREKNYLLSANLNFLLQHVQGAYIAFLSGDDFWELNNLEEKIKYYQAHPQYGMLYGGGYKYFYDTGKNVLWNSPLWKSGWVFKDLLSFNFINSIGVVIKKSTFDDIGLFDENSKLEDWDLWLRIAQKYPISKTAYLLWQSHW
jgi:glycosyltransferase involved in cell wall biosynthesis